jgi:tripartite-type tricarboxylate transporter receptor subunit TctC
MTPNNAGSGADLTARLFAERLAERWGHPVVVENRPGADGILAVTGFLGLRDEHSLLLSFAGIITINPLIHDKLPYDPARDIVPIVSASDNFYGVAASKALKVDSLSRFVELVRGQRGKLNWAAPPGLPYFAFMALQQSTGIDMVRAPYRDFAPALSDLGEGRIQAAVSGLGVLLPQVQAGKIKLLAVTNRERSSLAPDVPTLQEIGYPDLVFRGVIGFYGWRGIPDDLKERIAADVRAIAADPTIAARLESIGSIALAGTSSDFVAAIEEQRAKIVAITRAVRTK